MAITADAAPDVDWSILLVFPISFLAAALLCHVAASRAKGDLTKLPAEWDFSSAWAANATVLGTLLTGLFATVDPITALFGTAEPKFPSAVVGAAIAAILATMAPIVLMVARTRTRQISRSGLVVAGAMVTSAAASELVVVAYAAQDLSTAGWWSWVVRVGAVVAVLLLAAYTYRTVDDIYASTESETDVVLSGLSF